MTHPDKLLSCPFCGSDGLIIEQFPQYVRCSNKGCGLFSKGVWIDITRWNWRHDQQHKHSDDEYPPEFLNALKAHVAKEYNQSDDDFIKEALGLSSKTSGDK